MTLSNCPKCGGAGWLRYDVPLDDKRFGKAVPCECLQQHTSEASDALVARLRSQLSGTEQTWNLANWVGADEKALTVAADALKVGSGFWTFWGTVGTGKSGLLVAIVNSALNARMPARYAVVPELLDELRASYGNGHYEYLMEELKTIRVLALDELHRNRGTDWENEKMFELIDHRYRYWDGLLTVFGTNKPPDKGSEDPIMSRLCDTRRARLVRVGGPDLRPLAAELDPFEKDDRVA